MPALLEIDVAHLQGVLRLATEELSSDLHRAGVAAAEGGVAAAKERHPYEDRTGDLTGEARAIPNEAIGGADMTWPEDYASYVDEGTSRAKPYPFTPLATQVADRDLEHGAREAVEKFKRALER